MRTSDWIHTCHNMNKVTGFITEINDQTVNVFVTIPKNYGEIEINKSELIQSSNAIWFDDLDSLIDLSLMIKDENWFFKWINEKEKWVKVEGLNQ